MFPPLGEPAFRADLVGSLDGDSLERARTISSLKRRKLRGVQKRNDVRVEISDDVYVVDAVIVEIRYVRVGFVARQKPPTTVGVVNGRLAVHESHAFAFHRDAIGGETRTVPFRQRPDLSDVESQTLRFHKLPNAAAQSR